jgi:hypothetical protein
VVNVARLVSFHDFVRVHILCLATCMLIFGLSGSGCLVTGVLSMLDMYRSVPSELS